MGDFFTMKFGKAVLFPWDGCEANLLITLVI